jgi:hypothetical protein
MNMFSVGNMKDCAQAIVTGRQADALIECIQN